MSGDNLPPLTASLTNADGSPFDMSGAAVRFQMRPTIDRRLSLDAEAEIVDAPTAAVQYVWGISDLATAGDYLGRWEVAYDSGRVVHPDLLYSITVVPI